MHVAGGDGLDFAKGVAEKEGAGGIEAEGLALFLAARGDEGDLLAEGEAAGGPGGADFLEGLRQATLEGVEEGDEEIGAAMKALVARRREVARCGHRSEKSAASLADVDADADDGEGEAATASARFR